MHIYYIVYDTDCIASLSAKAFRSRHTWLCTANVQQHHVHAATHISFTVFVVVFEDVVFLAGFSATAALLFLPNSACVARGRLLTTELDATLCVPAARWLIVVWCNIFD
jgi:hypothetical protein